MDKKIVGLVGAMVTLAPAAALATPIIAQDDAVQSYADLLKPIPNATETLQASDAILKGENGAKLEMAQFYHHHHHHHFFHRPFYRHHHHHHFFRRRVHHHHHHHHFF